MSSPEDSGRLLATLDEALALKGSERRRFVKRLRREDPELGLELEELLATEDELTDDFLNRPVVEEHAEALMSTGGFEDTEDPEPVPGEALETPLSIGPYRLLSLLGSGGMGRVFLAEQTEPFPRRVALKLIRTSFMDASARGRFDAERQALARLHHPNIGRILDAGTTEDGFPYFALELVQGPSLTHYCDEHQLKVDQRLDLMVQICRGVEHAHRHQIIHRDLKPSNLLVAEVDGRAVPKIIDFGIAKSLDGPLTDLTLETGKLLIGAPPYMSPEALEGAQDLDTRTDVYSLGVLLYELLAGQRPYKSGEDSLPRLLRQVAEEAPQRPSTLLTRTLDVSTRSGVAQRRQTSVSELRHRLRGDLDWILLKAINKERDQRYGSASALADDLERHLRHQPVEAGPPSLGYRLGKLVRRHRFAFAIAAMLALVGVGGASLELHSRSRTERLARASEDLTREVERIEWLQRVAYLLPKQNRTADLERVRNGMARIEAKMQQMGSWGGGLGFYALGRGALGLGDFDLARRHLEQAWDLKFRRPEVALALGLTLGSLYERRLETMERLPDPETRQRLRDVAEDELRDPALELLARSDGADLASRELLDARVALYRRDLDTALAKSRAAAIRHPGLYEAKFLEAQALQRRAAEVEAAGELDAAEELLAEAERAVQEGLVIGRSDPNGYLRLCRIRSRRLALVVRYVRPGAVDHHSQAIEACASARSIQPTLPGVDLEEASVWLSLADTQVWDLVEDPAESLDHIATLLKPYLDGHADAGESYQMLGLGEMLRSTYQRRAGQDPRPAMGATIAHFEKALELEPGYGFVFSRLAQILAQKGYHNANRGGDPQVDYERAVAYGEAAIVYDPEDLAGYTHLAHALIFRAEYKIDSGRDPLSDLDRAEDALKRAAEIDPRRSSVPSSLTGARLARSFWTLKTGGDPTADLDGLIAAADRFLELNPGAAFGLMMRAQGLLGYARYAALQGNDPTQLAEECRLWYAKGIALLPRLPGPHVELAELALSEANLRLIQGRSPKERVTRVIEHAKRALEVDAERADAQRLLGEAELIRATWLARQGPFGQQHFERARSSLATAVKMEPGDAANHLALARLVLRALELNDSSDPGLSTLPPPLAPHGIAFATEALRLDPTLFEALAVRGALLALSPETYGEGRREVQAALEGNRNLAFEWQRWLDRP